jgi:hypothetical protein
LTDEDKLDALREALHQIAQWSEAYPTAVFPEVAARVLKRSGLSLDAISAHAMRHALDGVGHIAKAALKVTE